MGFLKSLFGRPEPKAEELQRPAQLAKTSDHPNAPEVELEDFGMPERHRWQVPDGIVVLNGKTWNQLRTVPIESPFTSAQLRDRAGRDTNRDISPIRLELEDDRVVAFEDDTRLGALVGEAAARMAPIVRDWTSREWQVWTWGKVSGMDSRRHELVAVLPTPDEPLYASAYDASFLFPNSKVMARRKTPEGKAEYDEFQRRVEGNRPRSVTVSFGPHRIEGRLLDWGGSGNWERRGIQLLNPEHGIYVFDDDISETWSGVWATYLAGAERNRDSARADFDVGRLVDLVPEPDNSYDRHAIAVRSADGRYKAGYVPRDATGHVRRMAAKNPIAALVQWEQRPPGSRSRQRLRLLIGPDPCTIDPAVEWPA